MPLFLPTVAIGVYVGFTRKFQRRAILRAGRGAKALSALKDAFAFACVSWAAGNTGHNRFLSNLCRLLLSQGAFVSDLTRMLVDPHHPPHVAGVAFKKNFRPAEMPPLLARTGTHQVAGQRVMPLEFPGLGNLETLGNALIGL